MNTSEIFDGLSKSKMQQEPYVRKIWELVNDKALFSKSPDYLHSLRRSLLRDALAFFGEKGEYYRALYERLNINPRCADLPDLAKLAVPSVALRGDGHKSLLIDGIDEGGMYFHSSGTGERAPVKIYRSPLDLAVMVRANASLFQHVYGSALGEGKGIVLVMAAPEQVDDFGIVAFVHLMLKYMGVEPLYGMDLADGDKPGRQWHNLVPNKGALSKFAKSKAEPKLLFTAPEGALLLAQRFDKMNLLHKVAYKLVTGIPPINLGRGGTVVTGGEPRGSALPPYDQVVDLSRKYIVAKDNNGDEMQVPFMDAMWMSGALTLFIDRYEGFDKLPHPLSQAFLLNPNTFEYMEEDGREGVLGVFDPFVTSWLEAICPGDVMISEPAPGYYGKSYKYRRRITADEGMALARASGKVAEGTPRGI